MRTTILGYILTFLTIVNMLLVCSLFSRAIYRNEIQTSVDNSIDLSMELLKRDSYQRITNNADKVSDLVNNDKLFFGENDTLNDIEKRFINILTSNLNSKITSVDVSFFASDDHANLISVEVIANFKYSNGSPGQVTSYKTMLLNKTKQ